MKRALLLLFGLMTLSLASAQNIQLHHDFGRMMYDDLSKEKGDRAPLTATIEMFKPDRWGSTFFFVDLDFNEKVTGGYFEIAREFNFWKESKLNWLSMHLEYNGGMNAAVSSYNNAWLAGPTYSGHNADFSKTWSVSLMYKYIPGTIGLNEKKDEHNFQITGVWNIHFAKGWMTFNGFLDFWRESRPWLNTEYIFLCEPQLWVNMNQIKGLKDVNLSFGSELEISNNFAGKGAYFIPTLAAKWTF
ncbi:MAG: DUF5020 family protein [Bacteroidales bacterium]